MLVQHDGTKILAISVSKIIIGYKKENIESFIMNHTLLTFTAGLTRLTSSRDSLSQTPFFP